MENNSCLMLMMSLWTPIDLDFVVSDEDLAKDGLERDPHITMFYAQSQNIQKGKILKDIKEFIGPRRMEDFLEFLKTDKVFPVYDVFGLDKFENPDFDVLILRLKDTPNPIVKILKDINNGFTEKYGIKSDFGSYKPHLTLSYLNSGVADKYLSDETLDKVLRDTKVSYDDLMVSYGPDGGPWKQWYLTSYNCISRNLRSEKLFRNRLRAMEE